MAKMIVCLFDARSAADAARADLLQQGFGDAHIRVAGAGIDAPGMSGLAGVIENMFSGLLHDAADAGHFAREVGRGRSLVAVGDLDDAAAERARDILARRVEPAGEARIDVKDALQALGAGPGKSGPRVYSLPNSPTAWQQATRGSDNSIGGGGGDPARPEGLLRDAAGLGTDADRSRLSGKP